MEIIKNTIQSFECPICRETYFTEKHAMECATQVAEYPAYDIGDVIKIKHYPNDYAEFFCAPIKSWGYKNKKHKTGLYYCVEESHEQYDREIVGLTMTAAEAKSQKQEVEDFADTLPDNFEFEIERSRQSGQYELRIWTKRV